MYMLHCARNLKPLPAPLCQVLSKQAGNLTGTCPLLPGLNKICNVTNAGIMMTFCLKKTKMRELLCLGSHYMTTTALYIFLLFSSRICPPHKFYRSQNAFRVCLVSKLQSILGYLTQQQNIFWSFVTHCRPSGKSLGKVWKYICR